MLLLHHFHHSELQAAAPFNHDVKTDKLVPWNVVSGSMRIDAEFFDYGYVAPHYTALLLVMTSFTCAAVAIVHS